MPVLLEEVPFFRELSDKDFSSIKKGKRGREPFLSPSTRLFSGSAARRKEMGQAGFLFGAENSDLKARLERLEQLVRSQPYLTSATVPIQ